MSYNTLRALLITSLIVNTLLIGYIIGGATSKQRPRWSPPMMLKDFHRDTFMGGERRLPPMLTQSFKRPFGCKSINGARDARDLNTLAFRQS